MRPKAVLDIECFRNWFLVAVRDVTKTIPHAFEMADGGMAEELKDTIRKIVKSYQILTFNGTGYDLPLLLYMLNGATTTQLKHASDRIIMQNLKPWHFEKEFNVRLDHPEIDHVDLMPVAPMTGSLKLYASRLQSRSIQDLPVDPAARVTEEQKTILREYCNNDLQNTIDLFNALKGQCELRDAMSEQYGIDLRSKSDPQLAEAVIKSELEKVINKKLDKPGPETGLTFRYQVPAWVKFSTPACQSVLDAVRTADFAVSEAGAVVLPKELASRKIEIGTGVYRMGIGGLHSSESHTVHRTDAETMLIDFDVAAYYPSILLNQGLYPKHLGPGFLKVYQSLVDRRLAAKAAKRSIENESLKICINGTFGKLGSKYSFLYAPDLFIQITITGQLALLMLIERLGGPSEVATIVSANTDGITVCCDRMNEVGVREIANTWELFTGFTLESKTYDSLYNRDVNNYVAIQTDGQVKVKGIYGTGLPLQKNPVNTICAKAVIDYLQFDADLATTIRQCTDVRKFISVRSVTGGAVWRGQPVGKIVRWYQGTGTTDAIHYKSNNYKVPKTDGAIPCTVLPAGIPEDLDYEWYIREATEMVEELGVICSEKPLLQSLLAY